MKLSHILPMIVAAFLLGSASLSLGQNSYQTQQNDGNINAGSGSDAGTSQGIGTGNASGKNGTGQMGTNDQALSQQTKTYVRQAGMADLFEIQSSRLALTKSKDANVLAFAKMMIHDHGQSTNNLKTLLSHDRLGIKPSPKLDAEHAKMLSDLKSASGKTFDSTYVKMQLEGHQKALGLHQSYAKSGDNPDLQQFADDTSKVVEQHLNHISDLAKSMNLASENP